MTESETPTPNVAPPPPTDPAGPSAEARQWAMFMHLSALIGYFLVPFGSIVAPLVMWQMKKNESPFIDEQGKEALNFQITVAIAVIVCLILSFVLIGLLLLPLVGLAALILTIMGGIKANEGVSYRYPFTLRLVT